MLKRVTLENFFSFGEPTTIELNPGVNLLVGINGSGKSNFLKAIRLLHEAVVGKGFEKTFLQEWGGFANVANVSGGTKDYIKLSYVVIHDLAQSHLTKYVLIIHSLGHGFYSLEENIFTATGNNQEVLVLKRKDDVCEYAWQMEENASKVAQWKNSSTDSGISLIPTESIFGQRNSFNISETSAVYRYASRLSVYSSFNTSSKSAIRQPSMFGTEEKLLPTGENLNSIIQKLKNNYSLDYEKIEDLLRDINPNFKDITFNLFGSKSYLLLREKNLANAISIEHLSDGTLRYLLLLAIFYNPNRGEGICIDEPETGLHPDMINTIAEAIKYAAKETQFFIATHSPLLLNAFDLDDVLIFEKDKKNQTKVEYKSEDDFEDWNENSLVGQLWLNGQLGGKRW